MVEEHGEEKHNDKNVIPARPFQHLHSRFPDPIPMQARLKRSPMTDAVIESVKYSLEKKRPDISEEVKQYLRRIYRRTSRGTLEQVGNGGIITDKNGKTCLVSAAHVFGSNVFTTTPLDVVFMTDKAEEIKLSADDLNVQKDLAIIPLDLDGGIPVADKWQLNAPILLVGNFKEKEYNSSGLTCAQLMTWRLYDDLADEGLDVSNLRGFFNVNNEKFVAGLSGSLVLDYNKHAVGIYIGDMSYRGEITNGVISNISYSPEYISPNTHENIELITIPNGRNEWFMVKKSSPRVYRQQS